MTKTVNLTNKFLQTARGTGIALCFFTLSQVITACNGNGSGTGSIQTDTNAVSTLDASTPQEATTVGGMFDTNTPGMQQMQSLNYIAEGQISFGATREVYATSDKYRMQSQTPVLSTRR
jgi:hypothetical protein